MAVATSTWFELVTALIAKLRANATITGATYKTVVTDGPVLAGGDRPNLLFVGAQPSNADWGDAAGSFEQSWGELGARARYEDVTVLCELVVQAGESRLERCRTNTQTPLTTTKPNPQTNPTPPTNQPPQHHTTTTTPQQQQN